MCARLVYKKCARSLAGLRTHFLERKWCMIRGGYVIKGRHAYGDASAELRTDAG